MNKPKQYYPFLDGFRAIGILMIIAHHMCVGFNLYDLFKGDPAVLTWLYFNSAKFLHLDLSSLYVSLEDGIYKFKGILGVQIFLIMSGFLITRKLLRVKLDGPAVGHFYLRRFLRIYPAYFSLVVLSLTLFVWQSKQSFTSVGTVALHYLLLLQNYFSRNFYLEHTWTLAIFEQFYFFAPLIVLAFTKLFPEDTRRRRALVVLCLCMLVLGACVRFRYLTMGLPLLSWPLPSPVPYFTITYHISSLAFGCLLALLETRIFGRPRNILLGWLCWIYGIVMYYYLFVVADWGYHWGDWYLNIFGYSAAGALLFAAYNGASVLARWPWMQWLGRHSYGIYIWHILVLTFWVRWMGVLPPTVLVSLYILSSIAVGVLSTKTLERYFLSRFLPTGP